MNMLEIKRLVRLALGPDGTEVISGIADPLNVREFYLAAFAVFTQQYIRRGNG
ncbi:MAG: hypothetical protein U5M50_00470 [Sphingobium sp.]|nr:hypothetical protein [Sphingobium sp.]